MQKTLTQRKGLVPVLKYRWKSGLPCVLKQINISKYIFYDSWYYRPFPVVDHLVLILQMREHWVNIFYYVL